MLERSLICAIGGLDATGGAGLIADAEAIHAQGAVPCAVTIAVTAQFKSGEAHIELMDRAMLEAQWRSIEAVGGPKALKIGMLGSVEAVQFVTELAQAFEGPIILDPVLKATSGADLLADAALKMLREKLLPRVTLVTPNLAESAKLLGVGEGQTSREMDGQLSQWQHLAKRVLLKGGHLPGQEVVDVLWDGERGLREEFVSPKINAAMSRGTGCRLASAIAAQLVRGIPLSDAVRQGRQYVRDYLSASKI